MNIRKILLLSLCAALPALMAPTGGFPSRPKFNSVGVGQAAPAGNGNLTATGTITAGSFSGSGASLSALNASNLSSGTVPDARFPATLPALSGVNLTALNATQLTSGTVPDARFPATLPAASGVNLTALNATNLSSGSVADARLSSNVALHNSSNLWSASQLPNATGSLDLGASTARWNLIYGSEMTDGASATWSIVKSVVTTLQAATGSGWTNYTVGSGSNLSTIDLKATSVTINGVAIPACSTGTFTGTLTGMTGSVTGTVTYRLCGTQVTLYQAGSSMSGTSNSTAMTMTGLPAAIQPIGSNQQNYPMRSFSDNGVSGISGTGSVTGGSGTITFSLCVVSGANVLCNGAFTNSGTKGLNLGWSLSYERNTG